MNCDHSSFVHLASGSGGRNISIQHITDDYFITESAIEEDIMDLGFDLNNAKLRSNHKS
jgi:hypothetical protein